MFRQWGTGSKPREADENMPFRTVFEMRMHDYTDHFNMKWEKNQFGAKSAIILAHCTQVPPC